MAAWLPDYGQGLQGWGAPPHLDAAPIAGLAASIWAMRNKERENLQQGVASIADTIRQQQLDKVANALSYKMENPHATSVPSDLPDMGGAAGFKLRIMGQQYDPYRQLTAKGWTVDESGKLIPPPMTAYQQGQLGFRGQEVGIKRQGLGVRQTAEERRIDSERSREAARYVDQQLGPGMGALFADPSKQEWGTVDPKTGQFTATAYGTPQTHVRIGGAKGVITTVPKYQKLQDAYGNILSTPQGSSGVRQSDVNQGADQNVVKGYSTSSTDMSAEDVRAAFRAGKMNAEEATARLKQLGFSD